MLKLRYNVAKSETNVIGIITTVIYASLCEPVAYPGLRNMATGGQITMPAEYIGILKSQAVNYPPDQYTNCICGYVVREIANSERCLSKICV